MFQHRYRVKSIYLFFIKEMICSIIIAFFSISIYLDYLDYFRGQDSYFVLDFSYPPDAEEFATAEFDSEDYGFEIV